MKKPESLRLALSQSIEYLRNHPDALRLSITHGTVVSTGVPAYGWEYRYTLKLAISEFTGSQDALVTAVCDWLNVNEPDALRNPERRETLFRFDIDMPGSSPATLSLSLKLTERVLVTINDGITTISAVGEPAEPEAFWLDPQRR